ncbi:MAG: hypothetical protein IJD66_00690 [Methanocorpusculum sp.]|nr:hypothetical protein [Methanocorpusculum sp.]MBQ4134010.1 hypothetical protein [Methanocorpusculum sp.]MBR4117686.1 hypothetical protein [Methanocorpusculum sp.]HJJ64471.1 hypothetical protein [Methanocorpusculum sp.]HJJ66357.1 hypothetical protein [Methanocorpusculum sp.]
MVSLEELAIRLDRLEKDNEELEERVRELELQIGILTERSLRGSCSSCHM